MPDAALGRETRLTRRQLYMLPTANGWLFGGLLLVLLMAALNYSNALAYALTFLLAAIAIVSMLYTHRNLLGLRVAAGAPRPVFVGEPATFPVSLHNAHGPARWRVCVEHDKRALERIDLQPGEQRSVRVEVPASTRGYLSAPAVLLSTRFPLDFFYAWSRRVELDQRCLVYPRPSTTALLPPNAGPPGWHDVGGQREGDDFIGLREYRRGDSPRHVSWKAVARGRGVLSKQFGGGYRASLWLDFDSFAGLPTEERLSHLCRWVLQCEQARVYYGLRLPGVAIGPAGGEEHQHRCLAALALFED